LAEGELYRLYQQIGDHCICLVCLKEEFLIDFYGSNGHEKFSETKDDCLMVKKIKEESIDDEKSDALDTIANNFAEKWFVRCHR